MSPTNGANIIGTKQYKLHFAHTWTAASVSYTHLPLNAKLERQASAMYSHMSLIRVTFGSRIILKKLCEIFHPHLHNLTCLLFTHVHIHTEADCYTCLLYTSRCV